MSTLTLSPGTFQQSSFDKIGYGKRYTDVYLSEGNYAVKSPLKLWSGTLIDGDPGAIINLMPYASTSVFPSMTPIFGQAEKTISDITIQNIQYNGNSNKQNVKWGKGFQNVVGLNHAKNVKIKNVVASSTQGDILRLADSEEIDFSHNSVLGCGHDGLYVERCQGVGAYHNVIYVRSNSGLRCKGSSGVKFIDNTILRTDDFYPAFSPGIQIQKDDKEPCSGVEVSGNEIDGTLGPNIWVFGNSETDNNPASDLRIHHNVLTNGGNMPKEKGITGVGGIVCDGWTDVKIEYNTIDSCLGYGILFGRYVGTSAGENLTAVVSRNIITNTKISKSQGLYSGGGLVNLSSGKYTVSGAENCVYGNVVDYYKISDRVGDLIGVQQNPQYVSSKDYHLKSRKGHYTDNGYVMDETNSPCIFSEYELGAYSGTIESSVYNCLSLPSVVIPRASQEELKLFVLALIESGYLDASDEISYLNVGDDFNETA